MSRACFAKRVWRQEHVGVLAFFVSHQNFCRPQKVNYDCLSLQNIRKHKQIRIHPCTPINFSGMTTYYKLCMYIHFLCNSFAVCPWNAHRFVQIPIKNYITLYIFAYIYTVHGHPMFAQNRLVNNHMHIQQLELVGFSFHLFFILKTTKIHHHLKAVPSFYQYINSVMSTSCQIVTLRATLFADQCE